MAATAAPPCGRCSRGRAAKSGAARPSVVAERAGPGGELNASSMPSSSPGRSQIQRGDNAAPSQPCAAKQYFTTGLQRYELLEIKFASFSMPCCCRDMFHPAASTACFTLLLLQLTHYSELRVF